MAAYSYHLRRINQFYARGNLHPDLDFINLDRDCVKFGRNQVQVDILLESTACANMISREHAEIRRSKLPDGTIVYHLYDRSLNGTYVNDYRVDGHTLLQPGDIVQFGHINGAAIQPGQQAPQPDAEFTYLFEKVPRQSLDAKMMSLLTNSAAAAGGRLPGAAAAAHQWPHPYALAGAHPAYLAAAAAGFNPYLSPMPPLIPAQNVGRGSPFATPYNAPLSSGSIMHPRQHGDPGAATASPGWLGVANAAQQNASAAVAGAIRHSYHRNQSPLTGHNLVGAGGLCSTTGSLPQPSSATHQQQMSQLQQQQQGHTPQQVPQASAMTNAHVISRSIMNSDYVKQIRQESVGLNAMDNRYKDQSARTMGAQFSISDAQRYGAADALIGMNCQQQRPLAPAYPIFGQSESECRYASPPSVSASRDRNCFLVGQGQPQQQPVAPQNLPSAAPTYVTQQQQRQVAEATSPLNVLRRGEQFSHPPTSLSSVTSPGRVAEFKATQPSPSFRTDAAVPTGTRVSGVETTVASFLLAQQQQQRNTVVVEAPVRTQADTSTLTSSTNSVASQRLSCSMTPQQSPSPLGAVTVPVADVAVVGDPQRQTAPVGNAPVVSEASIGSDKSLPKVECDSSVPSPPEDPGLRRSVESVHDADDDNQAINRDIYQLASAAQSRCLKDSENDDVFEITGSGLAPDSRPKSRSPSSPSGLQNAKRSPSPLRTALHSSKTSGTDLDTVYDRDQGRTGEGVTFDPSFNESSTSSANKKRRKTNEVARLLTDLSDSSFMYEMRRKEARIRRKLERKKKKTDRSSSSENSKNSSSDDESESSEGSKSEDEAAEKQSGKGNSEAEDDDNEPIKKFVEKSKNVPQKEKIRSKKSDDDDIDDGSSVSSVRRSERSVEREPETATHSDSDSDSDSDFADKKRKRAKLSPKRSTVASAPSNRSRRRRSPSSSSSKGDRKPIRTRSRQLQPPGSARTRKVEVNKKRRSSSSSSPNVAKRRSANVGASSSSNAAKRLRSPPSKSQTGRNKAKNARQTSSTRNSVDEDLTWSYHDPTVACAAKNNCLKPSDLEVQWVQCDDCTGWFHVGCVGCDFNDVKDEDEEFHCGCT